MSTNVGLPDELVGRPAQWREGQCERAATPVDNSVHITADERNRLHEPASKSMTRREYEWGKSTLADCSLSQWNVGPGTSNALR